MKTHANCTVNRGLVLLCAAILPCLVGGCPPIDAPPSAAFIVSRTAGPYPLFIAFTDQSTPGSSQITAWHWDFGDGATSTEQHPEHTYAQPGAYTVTLTATSSVGADTDVQTGYIEAGEAQVVLFPDPYLEAAVRTAIDKPTGDILTTDLVGVGFTDLLLFASAVADLTGLEYCTDLESINLFECQLSEGLALLAGLVNLRELDLLNTNVTDLTPLQGLRNLEVLTVGGEISGTSAISDLSPLAGLTQLRELSVSGTEITDLSLLAALTNLEHLSVTSSPLSDLTPLAGLAGLTELNLSINAITNLTPISTLINLETLYLGGNQITDAGPLAPLTNLTQLGLAGNDIADLSPLTSLTGLTLLELGAEHYMAPHYGPSNVSDISPLAGLTGLTTLDLSHTSVRDITPLANLTNLRRLYMKNTLVSDITPIVNNPGFTGALSDRLNLLYTPLDQDSLCIDIPELQARGARPSYRGVCAGLPPTITLQPQGATIHVGESHSLNIEATGEGTYYYWRRDHVPLRTHHFSIEYPLTIENATLEDTGWYTCLVTGEDGHLFSNPVYLEVLP